jgi:adenylate cyclase
MTWRSRFNASILAAVFGGLLTAGIGYFLHTFPVGSGLVNSSYQLPIIARGEQAVDEAVIVYLDEQSFINLGQPQNAPWDRSLHARLIRRLNAAGAKAIVFDVVFSDPNTANPSADEALANAIKESGRVILAADRIRTGVKQTQIVPPFGLLLDNAAGIGSAEIRPSADLVVREHTREEELPALSWAAAEFVGARATGDSAIRSRQKWVNYYGPANFIQSASYYQALDPAVVPDQVFSNKTVFVGARIVTKSAGERKDEYRNPFGSWSSEKMAEERGGLFISGVEIQATMFLNLLRGDWLERFSPVTERTILIVLGLVFGFALVRFKPVVATIVALVSVLAVAAVFYGIFRQTFTWFPWLIIVVQITTAIAWSILFNSVQLYVQRKLYEHTLSLYLSPKLVRKFSGNPDLLKPGAEKQVLTFFFSDIENFTSMSENMDSDDLANLMNHYFGAAVSGCIHATDGTVVKYIGDAIFAFWNAPELQADHEMRACEAALLFRDHGVHVYNEYKIRTRIGLHTGEANVGNFGSLDRVDYTALGANVNLASRVEGLNKQLGTQCLMTGATHSRLDDRLLTRELGFFRLKGLEKPIVIHELLGRPGDAESTRPWREAFAVALQHYKDGELGSAEAAFHRVLELRPDDGPARFYLSRIDALTASSPGETWSAELELKEK